MKKIISVEVTAYIDMYVDTDKTEDELYDIIEKTKKVRNLDDIYYQLIDNDVDVYDSNRELLSFEEFFLPDGLVMKKITFIDNEDYEDED